METRERRELGLGSRAVYSRNGYLIHGRTGSEGQGLWAWPFSLETLAPTADAFPISTSGFDAAVSQDGTLAYRDSAISLMGMKTLIWHSRTGEELGSAGQPQLGLREFALSPDGRWVVTTVDEPSDIWIQDLTRSTTTRLTFDPESEFHPTWLPSGTEIAYVQWNNTEPTRLLRKATDGTGEPEVLVDWPSLLEAPAWSRDGRYLVFHGPNGTDADAADGILYIELDGEGGVSEAKTFLSTPAVESAPKLSPDSRFIAYVSDESGRQEVYVRPFPSGGGRWQASVNGGTQPLWRDDGKELFYVEDQRVLMAVPVTMGQAVVLGQPQELFESDDLNFRSQPWPQYDVSADGQRFLTSAFVAKDAPPSIRIVQNWYEEFRDRE